MTTLPMASKAHLTRQQRRFQLRKGQREAGFTRVRMSKKGLRSGGKMTKSHLVKWSKNNDPTYRKPCGERSSKRNSNNA